MNHKQKLGYMALGAGILALGITIGQIITPPIEAQHNGLFNEITCRQLTVVDKNGKNGDWVSQHRGMKIVCTSMTKMEKTAILLGSGERAEIVWASMTKMEKRRFY